jgi:hypothetical protein
MYPELTELQVEQVAAAVLSTPVAARPSHNFVSVLEGYGHT